MKPVNWKDIAELVGLAAIVASLIFVGLQMKQDRQLARAASLVDLSATHIELSQLISNNKEIWISGLDGKDLSKEDRAIFDQIARSWHLRMLTNYYASQEANWNEGRYEMRVNVAAFDLYKHPGLRQWFDTFKSDYEQRLGSNTGTSTSKSFTDLVEERLSELDRESPEIPDTKSYMLP